MSTLPQVDLLWVAGGRHYTDRMRIEEVLRPYGEEGFWLIHGAARGADQIAEQMWRAWQLMYIGVPAEWGRYGKSAGPRRNELIAAYGPSRLIAFPGGVGTENAKATAYRLSIPVTEVSP